MIGLRGTLFVILFSLGIKSYYGARIDSHLLGSIVLALFVIDSMVWILKEKFRVNCEKYLILVLFGFFLVNSDVFHGQYIVLSITFIVGCYAARFLVRKVRERKSQCQND